MIELEDGLEIVDQHIAEERYNYEKLKDEVIYFNDIEEAYHAVAKRQIRESE